MCRIFEKSGLGPPNGHRYAPFLEQEWEDDMALFVPGVVADDEMTNGDGTQNDVTQVCHLPYVLTFFLDSTFKSSPFVIIVVVKSICQCL